MVRIVVLTLVLVGCANTDKPKLGRKVEAPYGWKYTYCPSHKDEKGCENF